LIQRFPRIGALNSALRARRATLEALAGTVSAGIVIQLTLIVTGVLLARALGPEDRGHLALLVLVAAIVSGLAPMGLSYALSYTLARIPQRAADVIRDLRRAIVIQLIAAIACAGVIVAVLTASRPGYVQAGAFMVLVAVPSSMVQSYGLGALQGLRRFRAFNLLRVAPNAAFAVSATVLFVADLRGLIEFAYAYGVSRALFAPITLATAWRSAVAAQRGDGTEVPETSWILRFGRHSMFGGTPVVEAYRVDQAIVGLFLPPVALGIYVVALALTNLPRFIARSIGMVATPSVASRSTQQLARRKMWQFSWLAVPIYLPIIVALWLAAPSLVDLFFGAEFAEAAPITRLLLVATALYCARRVLIDAARGAGYPGLGSVAEIAALVSVVALSAAFAPLWDTDGVAYAMIGSSGIALGVMIVGLLLPSARRAVPGAGWLETGGPLEARAEGGAGDAAHRAGEPVSHSA
jgi:O-antigen/teichoic acid export membrane protein